MAQANYNYDELSDTLYVSFLPGEKATGVELNAHILLRIDRDGRRAVGLTIFEYSLLAQNTDMGPRSFPLNGLKVLTDELREIVLQVISSPPVNQILSLSAYTPSMTEMIPITSLQPGPRHVGA